MPQDDRELKPTNQDANTAPADQESTVRDLTPEELAQQEGEIPPPKEAASATSADMAAAPKSAETNQQD